MLNIEWPSGFVRISRSVVPLEVRDYFDIRLLVFPPQTMLRDWGNGQGFRLADALTGVCAFGATGGRKTSDPIKYRTAPDNLAPEAPPEARK
jgi:hypothetical protein